MTNAPPRHRAKPCHARQHVLFKIRIGNGRGGEMLWLSRTFGISAVDYQRNFQVRFLVADHYASDLLLAHRRHQMVRCVDRMCNGMRP
jgi:hypothetical protein